MINTKIAAVIVIAAFTAGSAFSPPFQEVIAAVIATDVQCTGCVGANDIATSAVTTTKLASNSVNGGKISDGTISAADLGPDSVGASELKGLSKLIYSDCTFAPGGSLNAGAYFIFSCAISGIDSEDTVIATMNQGDTCFTVSSALVKDPNLVYVTLRNECGSARTIGTVTLGLVVFDK